MLSEKKNVEDHSQREDVTLLRMLSVACFKDFRSYVARSSTFGVEVLLCRNILSHAKVNEYWFIIISAMTQHNILKLDIAVHDTLAMYVFQSL